MKKICDFCGHYWSPSSSDKTTCGICGTGGKIIMGSKEDVRRNGRKKEKKINSFDVVYVDVSV